MKPTAIDLFAGAGGLSLGLEQAGFEAVFAIENHADACSTYKEAFPRVQLETADARFFDFRPWRGVDLVAGGPPCQPFSTGGLRRGSADDRDLLPTFVRAVEEIQPRAFLLENVPGLASPEHRDYLRLVLGPLLGRYRMVGPMVVNASAYGVPQSRRRLVMIGMMDRSPLIPPGHPTARPSAGSVLGRVPLGEPNASKIVYAKTPDLRPDPYHGHLFNGGGRGIDLERPAPTILASAGGNKTHFLDLGCRVPPYHAHLMAGGAPYVGDLPEARRLTVEESALLQTFPAAMRFHGSRSSRYTQIGNAVPPRLAAALGAAILDVMARAGRLGRVA